MIKLSRTHLLIKAAIENRLSWKLGADEIIFSKLLEYRYKDICILKQVGLYDYKINFVNASKTILSRLNVLSEVLNFEFKFHKTLGVLEAEQHGKFQPICNVNVTDPIPVTIWKDTKGWQLRIEKDENVDVGEVDVVKLALELKEDEVIKDDNSV